MELRLWQRMLLLLVGLFFVLPACAEDGNLLFNGDFELLDGDGLPSGWYTGAWVYNEEVSRYRVTQGRSGMAAVVENLADNDARFAQNVAVEPNTTYCLSGWIRTDGIPDSGRGANLSIEGVFVFSESVFDSRGEWVQVKLYGRTGADQDTLTVFARVGGYSGLSQGSAAFDDLRLEKVSTVAAGYRLEPLYVVPVEAQPVEEPEEAAAFWPWLLVLSCVYAAGAYLCCRHVCRDAQQELQDAARQRQQRWMLPVGLALAAVLRIIIALNVTGYQVDVNCFISWGGTFLDAGPGAFYQTTSFCDYPPGYLYVMGFNELLNRLFGGAVPAAFLHKLIPMICDLLAAYLVYHVARASKNATLRQAMLAAMLVAFNPAVILNSAAWCQVDSVLCLLLMLVAYLAMREKWALVLPVYVLAILVKPQALMMGFLGLAAIVMVLLRDKPSRGKGGKLTFPQAWRSMGWGLVWSLAVAVAIILPVAVGMGGVSWLFELYGRTLSSYAYATVNTANLYYLVGANWQSIQYPADTAVILALLLMCAAWCVVTFLRRRDRRLTLLEPAITIALTAGAALFAVAIAAMAGGTEIILTTGNPWTVYQTADGYVREFISGVMGTFAVHIPPVVVLLGGAALMAAAAVMANILRSRLRAGQQDHLCTGLIEPALMLLFTLTLSFMLVFDTTWGALGVVAMALPFAVVLPMFLRSGKMHMLPLCGAVLFILLYVFGVKMHERYLLPALFLLGMACALRRDRRLLWLGAGLAVTVFINAGIVLDNSIRLGSGMGHLNQDTHALACVVAAANVALALWSVWLCQRICCEDAPLELPGSAFRPMVDASVRPSEPCTPLNYQDSHHVRWSWKDAVLVGVVTAVYAIVTFTTLGSSKAPQNAYTLCDEQSQVVLDLGSYHEDFTFLYNCQVSYRDFTVETSDDGVTWTEDRMYWAQMAEGECFRWKYLTPYYMNGTKREYYGASDLTGVVHLTGRYVRITAQRQYRYDADYYPIHLQAQEPLIFNEILLRNAAGEVINASMVGLSSPESRTQPAWSMFWRVSDAAEAAMGQPLLDRAVSMAQSGEARPAAWKAPVDRARLALTTPSWAGDASALLDEQDTLDGEPGWWNSTYFDEIYHARTAYEHATGQDAYEWTHPPLGKVIMSWFVQLFGMTPFGWRFAGALCGVLMLPAMYLIAKQLTKKRLMAFAAMVLMALDCMHFTQTRLATIDSYPVLFIILSYFFMLRFIQRDIVTSPMKRLLPDLALSGFFMGCGVASKWIGIYAGIGLAVLYFWACARALRVGMDSARMLRSGDELTADEQDLLTKRDRPAMRRVICLCLWCLLFFVAVPLAIYLGSYIVHYQAREVNGIVDWLRLVWQTQVNILNYHGTPGLGMDHAYYSPWYEWFTMQTPMYYASPSFTPDGWRYAIYCFGNPVVWYGGLAGLMYVALRWVRNHLCSLPDGGTALRLRASTWCVSPAFVLIGFAAQILPWVLVPRGTYIYHYFASVPFLILALVLGLNSLYSRRGKSGLVVTVLILAAALVMFVYLFPYASGVLSPSWWMDSIRNYPWTGGWLGELMQAIPLVPNVW